MTKDVLASLERSRKNIITKVLPIFASLKNQKLPPPAQHTLTSLSNVTLSIGPHTFTCNLLLVVWAPETRTMQPPPPQDDITPLLIQQLNDTAAQDPVLAGVLSRAKTGEATTDELQGLASYVEAMRQHHIKSNPPLESVGEPIQYQYQAPQSLVLEFEETKGEQFVIPSHFRFETGEVEEVIISFFIPIESTSASGPAPCTIVFYNLEEDTRKQVWTASRTSREIEPQLEEWWKSSIGNAPLRAYVIDAPDDEPEPIYSAPAISNADRARAAAAKRLSASRSSSPATGRTRRKSGSRSKLRDSMLPDVSNIVTGKRVRTKTARASTYLESDGDGAENDDENKDDSYTQRNEESP